MKFLIALSLLVTSVASIASTRSIFDLQYLPNAGTVYGTTDLSVTNYNIYDRVDKTDIDYNRLNQTVGFSVMDNLLLSLSADYLQGTTKSSGSSTLRTEGLSDPTVSGKFRVMDGEYIFDVIADYVISLDDKKINGGLTRSNNRTGGASANLAAHFGSKAKDFQWAVLARYTRNFESTTDFSGTKSDTDAHNAYFVEGSTLMDLSAKDWKFKTSLSTLAIDKRSGDLGDSASVVQVGLGGEWQYICSANLMARGGIQFQEFISDRIQQYNAWKFNLGATYQF